MKTKINVKNKKENKSMSYFSVPPSIVIHLCISVLQTHMLLQGSLEVGGLTKVWAINQDGGRHFVR